jgi:hypothetical protein
MDIGQNDNKRQIKRQRTLNEIMTDVEQMKQNGRTMTATRTDDDSDDDK